MKKVMTKVITRSMLIGAVLGLIPGTGAIASQTNLLDSQTKSAEIWEPIPDEPESDPARTHEVAEWWWFDHGNDPDIPDEVEEAAVIYGEMFSVAPELLIAIADVETGGTFDTSAENASGTCIGLMQINPRWHKARMEAYGLTEADLYEADASMLLAASYIQELVAEHEDIAVALYKYNGASTALNKYYRTGICGGYAQKVLDKSAALEQKYGK